MADLNQGTRQRNLRRVSGGAAVPSGNTRSVSSGGPPAPSTDWIQALGGRIGGWCIENGKLTADGGNVKLNSFVPSISLGAASDYITGTGFWVGKNSAVYKLHLGDPAANHLKWDGSTLTVVGTISAAAGAIGGWTIGANSISADGGAAVIDSSVPKITLGAASDYLTGAGFFVGKSGGAYKFRIGDPEGNYVKWDGGTGALTLNGTVTTNSLNPALQSFTTSIVFSSTDNNTVSWTAGTIRLASGVTYAINAGNTGDMAALTYIYLDTAVSTTALQTTTSYNNAVGDGRVLVAAAQNHGAGAAGASVIPYTGQQPIINGGDQIATGSILAANIAAGAITADKISVTTLAAIQANLGAATISDVLTIGASGGIYQGTGTFGSPTTGLKIWNESGIGRLATYLSGTPQVYLDTSGKLNAGGGNVTLDGDGIAITAGSILPVANAKKVRWLTGSTLIASVAGYDSGVGSYAILAAGSTEPVYLQVHDGGVGARTVDVAADTFTAYANSYIGLGGLPKSLTVYGGLNVGTATGAGTGNILASGKIISSANPRFLARVSSSILNVTGDGTGYTVVFNTEAYDDGGNYNPATGVFTAPVSGRYHFDFTVSLEGITSTMSFAIIDLIAGGRTFRSQRMHAFNCFDNAALALHGSADAAMTAGQTAYVVVYIFGGAKVVDVTGHATEMLSYFDGHLIA